MESRASDGEGKSLENVSARGSKHSSESRHLSATGVVSRNPGYRTASFRVQVTIVYAAGDCQHAGDGGAYATAGEGPMFMVSAMDFGIPRALPFYLLLGVVCGLAAVGFSRLLYWVEDQFEKLPIDELWWPAIGALGLGIIGYLAPRVLGVGYDTISDILNASLGLKLLVVVMAAKAVALLVSLGSGTSGGLLAPMFMSSAALGGAFAMIMDKMFPAANLSVGAFALVAMGAVFGVASRATFSGHHLCV